MSSWGLQDEERRRRKSIFTGTQVGGQIRAFLQFVVGINKTGEATSGFHGEGKVLGVPCPMLLYLGCV